MYKKIAVSLDGSPFAEKALPYAVKLANILNSELLLLRIAELQPLVSDNVDHELEAIETSENYLKNVEKVISDTQSPLFIAPERLQPLVAYGKPEKKISEIVPFEEADLLVMTTHGRKGLSRMVQGSVSTQVLHHSKIPIILIKPEDVHEVIPLDVLLRQPTPLSAAEPVILMTLDGTKESEVIIKPTIELVKKLGAQLHVICVLLPPMPVEMGSVGTGFAYEHEVDKAQAAIETYLQNMEKQIADMGVTCVTSTRVADPATEIVAYANDIGATLIAMATHARSGLGQMVMGSVADEVMRQSHLPVMMMHMPTRKERSEMGKMAGSTH
jgi:nucleotide-binding universal stress UspA family protein